MAPTFTTEQVYSSRDRAGVAGLVACCSLSLVCVLGVFFILGMSLILSPRDKTIFVRTQTAKFLSSLLLCNLIQAIGGLLNIAWLIENRIYFGMTCRAQTTLKQIGNTGPATFNLVIAAQTFCQIFLNRHWEGRTCHIIHIVSWAFVVFELCFENFVLAKPEIGPYQGISTPGYWCWISPQYKIERFATDYLFMSVSATFSLILYSLIFFRLRGNVSVEGYKISFHRRDNIRFGRTSGGAMAATGDRRAESYVDTVARHMLWYPIVYMFIVFPMVATRYPAFSGLRDYPEITFIMTAIFNLHGVYNAVLFLTTRRILPDSWRQRIGLSTIWDRARGDTFMSSLTSATCWFARPNTTATCIRPSSAGLDDDVEKDAAGLDSSFLESGSRPSSTPPTIPIVTFQAYGGSGQRENAHEHHIRLPSPARREPRASIPTDIDVDDRDSDIGLGVHRASTERTEEWEVPQYPRDASSESGAYGPAHV